MIRSDQIAFYYQRIEVFFRRLRERGFVAASVPLQALYRVAQDPIPFADRDDGTLQPLAVGEIWGHAWDSAWFHVQGDIPSDWPQDAVVLRMNVTGEACVFSAEGCPLQGLTGGSVFLADFIREYYPVPAEQMQDGRLDLWVEAACNTLMGIRRQPDPPAGAPTRHGRMEATLQRLEAVLLDETARHFLLEFGLLFDLLKATISCGGSQANPPALSQPLKALPEMPPRQRKLLAGLNEAIDVYAEDPANAAAARKVLAPLLAARANASDAVVVAVGHAHIDTGWLWPVRESVRKCERTFATQVSLLEQYPDYVFGASSAQHYAFIKERRPALYEKIKALIAAGRWEVQGGMWVEPDCNLISGESMVRQFLHGKNFFRDAFGLDIRNLWIPDVFGYSAALPQIMRQAGADYLLTQKISWNQFNPFPHNTFRWRGIDGSEVLTHFPPEDTYNSVMSAGDQIKAQSKFKEGHLLDAFLCLFGIGDGGGGPKAEFIEKARLMGDLEGVPKVRMGRADAFFERLAPHADALACWEGELYLELHRGTLTSQARTKLGNRRLEHALQEVEFVYSSRPDLTYPAEQLDRLWKILLINQFHDILPGSSIKLVYDKTEQEHAEALAGCAQLLEAAGDAGCEDAVTLLNVLGCAYEGPVRLPATWMGCAVHTKAGDPVPVQAEGDGVIGWVKCPAAGSIVLQRSKAACAEEDVPLDADRAWVLENDLVRYVFSENGVLTSAYDKRLGRDVLQFGKGNVLSLYMDRPANWDAWDVDLDYTRMHLGGAESVSVTRLSTGAVQQGLRFVLRMGHSEICQDVILYHESARLDFVTDVDWRERHNMLRVAFEPMAKSQEAICDIQFGYVKRPTVANTSWDMARFEVAAHEYVDITDGEFGAALLSDCKYGYRVHDGVLDLNLLRAPTYPDADADQGKHRFTYTFLPHTGEHCAGGVVEVARCLNQKPVVLSGDLPHALPFTLEGQGIRLAACKRAEKSDALVVRLVEEYGRHNSCQFLLRDGYRLVPCDLLEWQDAEPLAGGEHEVSFKPFEIKTFKIVAGDLPYL